MAVFDEKFDLPQSKISDYLRYQELFLKTSRTSAEEVEFQNLQNELKPYLIEASDWNQLTNYVSKHEFQDNDTGKTYKYGFKQENGFVVFMYEEVI